MFLANTMLLETYFNKILVCIIFMLASITLVAQENHYQSVILDSKLVDNANAVVRLNTTKIEILAYNKMLVKRNEL